MMQVQVSNGVKPSVIISLFELNGAQCLICINHNLSHNVYNRSSVLRMTGLIRLNEVEVLPLDITDLNAVRKSIKKLKNVDGFVFCAGEYWPMPAQHWDIGKLKSMIDVNLIGALHTLDVILPIFMEKNSGHLVFTGSLAGYRGVPGALGYGSSKAAIVNLSETLRYDLKDTAIKVQLINPGFVKTRLTDKNKFKMLQIMSPEVAAGKMFSNMNKNSFSSSFPAPFSWLFRVSQLLPDSIYFKLF